MGTQPHPPRRYAGMAVLRMVTSARQLAGRLECSAVFGVGVVSPPNGIERFDELRESV